MMPFFTIERGSVNIPLIANIPHSSIYIPPKLRETFVLNDQDLESEIVKMTDWYVDALFSSIPEAGGVSVIYNVSRLVVDPERFENDDDEKMSEKGMGVIYTKTSDGRDLRRGAPMGEEREKLLDTYYRPYHKALEKETQALLATFGRCLILDCHSFPSNPLPYEDNQDPDRPDICLGTDAYHTTESLVEKVEEFLNRNNLSNARNTPFAGTYVPLKFLGEDRRVQSLMIEINRKLYMNEGTGKRSENFDQTRSLIGKLVNLVAGDISKP